MPIFFEWEQKGSLIRSLKRVQLRFLLLILLISYGTWVYQRERKIAQTRLTHTRMVTIARALSAYRADHRGQCPPTLEELTITGYLGYLPQDARNHPFHFICLDPEDPFGYQVWSDHFTVLKENKELVP
ncbi:hypothetical protein [Pajaroellobacter abortibovis]|uniref:Type II secretion system protein GspG C-terminal domain-containing protein n=1 Tax=Pajaroellobacter abortibovis TaxID=1882918 RepID=A0A1L6MWT6_9BACT|nr:hypothetical protein [Pajaroellobacter abortibovis]APS00020.1 hypothetical protein BCY86_04460 [Pajaroellobacter abortibovis]